MTLKSLDWTKPRGWVAVSAPDLTQNQREMLIIGSIVSVEILVHGSHVIVGW